MTNEMLHRRAFLGAVGMAGVGFAAAACTGDADPSDTRSRNAAVQLPKYIALDSAKPDLAGTDQGVLPAYLTYPSSPDAVVSDKPGSGETVSILAQSAGAFAALDRNEIWRGVNDALGVELRFTTAPPADYSAKFATVIAGNELPDMIQIPPGESLRDLPMLLERTCHDLTDLLSGEAIADYPGLANLPPYVWRNTVFNGKILGLPIPRGIAGNVLYGRADIAEELGITLAAESGEEFLDLCRQFTDTSKNRWAINQNPTFILGVIMEMVGAPNQWEQNNGTFRSAFESDTTKRALEIITRMWREQLFHPDSFTGSDTTTWVQGRSLFVVASYAQWTNYVTTNLQTNPKFRVGVIPPPNFDGKGPGTKHLDKGVYSISAIRKTEPARAKELLRIANWLASPFGSREYLLRRFGVEGKTFTRAGTEPKLAPTGTAQVNMPDSYIMTAPSALYAPGHPDITRQQHAYQQQVIPTGVRSAAVGLYSATQSRDGARLTKKMTDLQADVIQGRRPLSAWDEGVKTWKSEGGDAIRAEYETAFDTAAR